MPKKAQNYLELKSELDNLMLELQREDIGIDEALAHYRRGLELVGEVETYLKTAENQVQELKAKFDNQTP